jgi:hypothetical protein
MRSRNLLAFSQVCDRVFMGGTSHLNPSPSQSFKTGTLNERLVHHVSGRANPRETLARCLRICRMLENGNYSAWFRTPNGDGTGIVILFNGTIIGGDSFFEYSGWYEQSGDRLTAIVRTRRLCDGPPAVFGIDEVELKLEGRCQGQLGIFAGASEQAPCVSVEVTLMPRRDDLSAAAEPIHQARPFDAAKLPKSPIR